MHCGNPAHRRGGLLDLLGQAAMMLLGSIDSGCPGAKYRAKPVQSVSTSPSLQETCDPTANGSPQHCICHPSTQTVRSAAPVLRGYRYGSNEFPLMPRTACSRLMRSGVRAHNRRAA